MKKNKFDSDLEEAKSKVLAILKEYSACIEYDMELQDVIIFDEDTKKFEYINK